jgi:phosphoglycolate phosphatase-like HAD superfamily hydrolase
MKKVKLWIFDIDGTLANGDHRAHHLQNGKRDWDAFFANQHLDEPYEAVFDIMSALTQTGHICVCVTGRPEEYRDVTLDWVRKHGDFWFPSWNLIMRPTGNKTDDHELKWKIVQELLKDNPHYVLCGVFDDRHRIIDKFRSEGVYVFECNQNREAF